MGSGGLSLENIFRVMPSRISVNALLKQEIKLAVIIDHYDYMEN